MAAARTLRVHPLEALVVLALNTEMQLDELLALHWCDVHPAERYVEVAATLLQDGKTGT